MAGVDFSGKPNKGSVVRAAQPGDWTHYNELLMKQGNVDTDKLPDFIMTQQGSDKTWTFKVEAPKGQENNPSEWLFTRSDNKGAQTTQKPETPADLSPHARTDSMLVTLDGKNYVGLGRDEWYPAIGDGKYYPNQKITDPALIAKLNAEAAKQKPRAEPAKPGDGGGSNTQTPLPSGVVKAMDGMASAAFVYKSAWQKWVAARKAEAHGDDPRIKQWLQIMLDSIIYPESKGAYIEWMRKIGVPDSMLPSGGYKGEYRYASDADARGLKPAFGGQRLGADENGKGALQLTHWCQALFLEWDILPLCVSSPQGGKCPILYEGSKGDRSLSQVRINPLTNFFIHFQFIPFSYSPYFNYLNIIRYDPVNNSVCLFCYIY